MLQHLLYAATRAIINSDFIRDKKLKSEQKAQERKIHKENTKPVLGSNEIEEILKGGR